MRGVGLAVVLSVAFLLVAAPWAAASTYYWDNNSNGPPWGGAGTWNTTTSNWAANTSSPYGFTTWSPNTTSNGNTAVFQGTAGAVSLSGTIYANALQFDVSGYTIQSGTLYLSQSSPTITVTNSSHTATISSVVTGSAGLKKSGSGTLILSGANSYLNTTTISAGTLSVSNVVVSGGGTSGLGNSTTAVVLGGTTAKGTLNYTGAAATYTRGFTIGTGGGELDNNGSGLLTVSTGNVTNTTNGAFTVGGSGDVTINSVIGAGSGTLTKTGAGTLTLTNTNTYTGTTTVSQGKLLVNGSTHASSAVSVASGATLGGSGTIGGSVNVAGILAPGTSIETIDTGNLTITGTGTLDNELGRSGVTPVSDLVNVTGTVTLASGANLQLTLFAGLSNPVVDDIFYLVSNDLADAVPGVFTKLNGTDTTLNEGSQFTWNSQPWQITYTANYGTGFTGGNDIALKVMPEPATLALLSLGGLGLLLNRKRR
jgi:autotransporter-associated beta strand protein